MTPLAHLLSRLLAKLRPALVQPYPTGPIRKAEPVGRYIGWGACTMSRDHRYENASACLGAGDVERASWWVLAMTYTDERAHLTMREDV